MRSAHDAAEHEGEPARVGGAQDVGDLREVDPGQDHDERDHRDGDPDEGAEGPAAAHRDALREPASGL